VLERILHHTAVMTKKGILTYYQRGLNYASSRNRLKTTLLEMMYASTKPDYADLGEFWT
jgi:hypothetical protein